MRYRINREDFPRTIPAVGLESQVGGWKVCQDYVQRGDKIVALYSQDDYERWSIYSPLRDEPDLFLRFARLHEARDYSEAVLHFAKRYGLPSGREKESFGRTIIEPDRMNIQDIYSETRRAWVVLSLYEAVVSENSPAARNLLEANAEEPFFKLYYRLLLTQEQEPASNVPHPELLYGLLASATVSKQIVDKQCSQNIGYDFSAGTEVSPSHLKFSWVFESLIGAMYLQMLWFIMSGGSFTRCENCNQVISLSDSSATGRKRRSDRRFCNAACRQATYRKKNF